MRSCGNFDCRLHQKNDMTFRVGHATRQTALTSVRLTNLSKRGTKLCSVIYTSKTLDMPVVFKTEDVVILDREERYREREVSRKRSGNMQKPFTQQQRWPLSRHFEMLRVSSSHDLPKKVMSFVRVILVLFFYKFPQCRLSKSDGVRHNVIS